MVKIKNATKRFAYAIICGLKVATDSHLKEKYVMTS